MKLKIAFITIIFLAFLLGLSSTGKASPPPLPQRIRQVAQLMGGENNQRIWIQCRYLR